MYVTREGEGGGRDECDYAKTWKPCANAMFTYQLCIGAGTG
jgi:hypothetical protein